MKSRLFIAGLLFCPIAAWSQVAVTNTGILYIKSGTDIFCAVNNFTNSSSALLTNNGSLYVKGNLTNDQTSMAIGTGTLYFNGSSAQTLSGSQPFKTYNLNTNNNAGIILNTNLSITGTHTFTAGVITTSATPNYLIYESGSSYTGASDVKHVKGWVKKIGSTNFTFPTGNGTYMREITLQNLAVSSVFDVQYSGATYNPANFQSPLASVDQFEHWTVNEISGGAAQVQLNWDNSKVTFPNYIVADLKAAVYGGTQWTNAGGSASGTAATTGTITSNSIAGFGRFAIGSTSHVIPLKFLGISAALENSLVLVKWQTANEAGVENYNVQRSTDGINFSTIATINATNMALQSYQCPDKNSMASKLYYRVRSNDFDGRTGYSGIVMITTDNIQKIQLVNNPAKGFVQLTTQNIPASYYFYQLINSAGQVCKKGSFSCEGSSLVTIQLNNVAAGQYTLAVSKAGEEKQFKLLIQ